MANVKNQIDFESSLQKLEDIVSKLILKKLSDKSDKTKRISYQINDKD